MKEILYVNWKLDMQFQEVKTEVVVHFDRLLNTATRASLVPVSAGTQGDIVLL